MPTPDSVLRFWFEEIRPDYWWKKDLAFDAMIAERFGALLDSAKQGELSEWREAVRMTLTECSQLDTVAV